MANKFNNKPHFPFTYGEEVKDDGKRLSDLVVDKLSNKKIQKYLGAVAEGLSAYFTPHVVIDGKPATGFHNFKNPYKVSIRQYAGSNSY